MNRSVSYTILILRTQQGYLAYAPAFPELTARASSGRVAYARLKVVLKDHLAKLLASSKPLVPRDPVFQTKTLRLDLLYLSQREDLA
jgi:predicted RNase H-like HicB family nuclease